MAVVTTNLGVVTAYGEAVNGGYTGTKAEFQEAMNNYAQGITNASEALSTANANTTKIGTLSNLTTTAKTNLVAAVNELDSDVTALNADITAISASVDALDGGISTTARTLLMTILNACVYTSDQSDNLSALQTALEDDTSEVVVTQSGSTLILSNVATVQSITQSGSTLALA